jgi:hypothetical protein
MTDVYGPQEATVDDVINAITTAGQASYAEPGWRGAWETVDATGGNHLRSVQRESATAAEAWAALRGDIAGPEADRAIASYLAPGPQPRYDTPRARAEAQAARSDPEAGG